MRSIFILLAIALVIAFSGCTDKNTGTEPYTLNEEEDDASIQNLINDEEGTIDSFRLDTDSLVTNEGDVFFYRTITAGQVTFEVNFPNDNYAEVTKNIHLEGVIHLFADDSLSGEKEFTENAVRYFDMERNPNNQNGYRGWKIANISGKEFWSDGDEDDIISLEIITENADTLITDISPKMDLTNIVTLPRLQEITLIVRTNANDDQVYFHYPFRYRQKFTNNGDNSYTITFQTPFWGVLRRFGVDVLSHDTLYDNENEYDSNGWGIIYKLN